MARLALHFAVRADTPSLERTRYVLPDGSGVCECERGGKVSPSTPNTFPWSSGIRALALLFCTYKESGGFIEGEARSAASSLDYAISKDTQWLLDMLGVSVKGKSFAKRIFVRINSNRKRPGPVKIFISESVLPADEISIFINNEPATRREIHDLVQQLSKYWKPSGKVVKRKDLKTYTQLIYLDASADPSVDPKMNQLACGLFKEFEERLSEHPELRLVSNIARGDSGEQDSLSPIPTKSSVVIKLELNENEQLNVVFTDSDSNKVLWSTIFHLRAQSVKAITTSLFLTTFRTLDLDDSKPPFSEIRALGNYEAFLRSKGLANTNRRKDFELAEGLLDHALTSDGSWPEALGLRSYLTWRRYFLGWGGNAESLERARLDAENALKKDSSCRIAQMALVRLYWDLGLFREALSIGRLSALYDQAGAEGRLTEARALLNCGQAKLGHSALEKVFAFDPHNPTALKLEIWLTLMLRQFSETVSLWEQYRKRVKGDVNTVWAALMALLHLGDFKKAQTVSETALELEPYNTFIWTLLGYVHVLSDSKSLALDAWREALVSANAGLKGCPTNFRLRSWKALILAEIGDKIEALDEIEEIARTCSTNSYILNRLCHAYAALGRTQDAVDCLNQAIHQGFLSFELNEIEELTSLKNLVGVNGYKTSKQELQKASNVAVAQTYKSSLESQYRARVGNF